MMFKYSESCSNINIWEIQTVASSYERIKEETWATNYIGGRKKFT